MDDLPSVFTIPLVFGCSPKKQNLKSVEGRTPGLRVFNYFYIQLNYCLVNFSCKKNFCADKRSTRDFSFVHLFALQLETPHHLLQPAGP